MQSDETEIIERVLAGETERYAELVNRYQARLLGLLWHACGTRELAEDIGQEAFLRAYRKLDLFAGQSQFYTWLARIAMNLLASHKRKRQFETQSTREGFDVAVDSVGDQSDPSQRMELSETQRCVRAAIDLLDEERRIVILLRDFDGMDYSAISQTLDVPVGTVRSRLHRARAELRQIFQQKAVELGLGEL